MWVLEIVATNSPPFRHTDLFKDSARMVICEELHVKAHSVLASCEMSSPSWKMLPSVQIGSLLRWSCLSPLLQKGGNELEAFLQVFFASWCSSWHLVTSGHLPVPWTFLLSRCCSKDEKREMGTQYSGKESAMAGGNKLQTCDVKDLCLLLQTTAPLRHLSSIPRT